MKRVQDRTNCGPYMVYIYYIKGPWMYVEGSRDVEGSWDMEGCGCGVVTGRGFEGSRDVEGSWDVERPQDVE